MDYSSLCFFLLQAACPRQPRGANPNLCSNLPLSSFSHRLHGQENQFNGAWKPNPKYSKLDKRLESNPLCNQTPKVSVPPVQTYRGRCSKLTCRCSSCLSSLVVGKLGHVSGDPAKSGEAGEVWKVKSKKPNYTTDQIWLEWRNTIPKHMCVIFIHIRPFGLPRVCPWVISEGVRWCPGGVICG
jgi:hypothetical protein